MIPRLHVPLTEPEDVVRHLGKQEQHWKAGRSAHALASTWAKSNSFPENVAAILNSNPTFRSAELVDAFMERQVDLSSEGRHSQTDLLAIAGLEQGIAIVAVEGKAGEPFGELVQQWFDGSDRKKARLESLCELLGLSPAAALPLRYQLLHRSVSAIREAKRYRTDIAVLLVHSFGNDEQSFAEFGTFLRVLGFKGSAPGTLAGPIVCGGVRFFAGWVQDTAPTTAHPQAYLDDLHDYAQRLGQWCDRVRAWCRERKGGA